MIILSVIVLKSIFISTCSKYLQYAVVPAPPYSTNDDPSFPQGSELEQRYLLTVVVIFISYLAMITVIIIKIPE